MVYACAVSGANILRDMREAVINTIGGHMTKYEALLDTDHRARARGAVRARPGAGLRRRARHPHLPPHHHQRRHRGGRRRHGLPLPGNRGPVIRIDLIPGLCPLVTHNAFAVRAVMALARCYKPRGRLSVFESSPGSNSRGQNRETMHMALKAPGILIFTLSIIVSLAVLFSRFFGANVPLLTADTTQFYAMWGAYLVLRARLRHARACSSARAPIAAAQPAMCRSVARLLALWKSSCCARPLSGNGETTPLLASTGPQRRARRWVREIVLAAMLTIAAVGVHHGRAAAGQRCPARRATVRDRAQAGDEIVPGPCGLRALERYCAVQPPSIE